MKNLIRIIIFSILLFSSTLLGETKITLQLQWLNQFQFAGFYVAQKMGYYTASGLDVTILGNTRGIDVVEEVITNKAEFGIGRSSLLIDRANGKKVVGLMAIYQQSPSVLISIDKNIKKPYDLKNKKVMITSNEASSASIVSMLLSADLKASDIKKIPHSFDLQDLIDGKTDAMACYTSNEPFSLEQKGIDYTIFDPKNFGFDFYGDILFTSEYMINQNPDIVKKFYNASLKGWQRAFENIEQTAKLIYDEYNTQNKSLESLIYEGKKLKELAFVGNTKFGSFDISKLEEIANVYKLAGLIKQVDIPEFIEAKELTKQSVNIGILAKRGEELTLRRWNELAVYLNAELPSYHFTITPLNFEQMEVAVSQGLVDFILLNTMNFVQFQQMYGLSRIATLKISSIDSHESLTEFGGVIFTKKTNTNINSIKDIKNKRFGAVDPSSFGGWVMARRVLEQNNIKPKNIKLSYFETHDNVVKALLDDKVEVATVRTDTLERMAYEGNLDLSTIKVLNLQHYSDFPYLVSTELYPEWPMTKLKYTSDSVANDVLSKLLAILPNSVVATKTQIDGWTIPLDYSKVYEVLKELQIYPFDNKDLSLAHIYEHYKIQILAFSFLIVIVLIALFYNQYMKVRLEHEVKERTQELLMANMRLKELASTDELTKISNRRDFLHKLNKYIAISKRNDMSLTLLSLDIDHFKSVNDTYGHDVGDEILKLFCDVITKNLRESDIFGRVGGEEFAIALHNTDSYGALVIAQKLRKQIEDASYKYKENEIKFTVSIGISTLFSNADSEDALMKRADIALYKAKQNGRNRVELS